MSEMTFAKFAQLEQAANDTIDINKTFVEMVGDLVTGTVLTKIIDWYANPNEGGLTRRVERGGKFWFVVRREEWQDSICISSAQADRALKILEESGLIERALYGFNGGTRVHVRLIEDAFLDAWHKTINAGGGK